MEATRIQDSLEEIAVEAILKYLDQIKQKQDVSSQYHPYEASENYEKARSFLRFVSFKVSFTFSVSRVIREGYDKHLQKIK